VTVPPLTSAAASTAAPTSTSTEIPTTTTTTTAATTAPPTGDPDLLAGQRVLCTFTGTSIPAAVLDAIASGRAAGVLLFAANLTSMEQARALTEHIQAAAAESPLSLPAMVAADQEGGIVARVPGPPSESAAVMGTWPVDAVQNEASRTAANLRDWGINVDLAPVADVARPGTFEARQRRSFSADPQAAAASVAAFVRGVRAGGVAATLKHFPGLGSVVTTTDEAAAVVTLTTDELGATDLVPFAAGIDAGADLVMMSSAVYTAFSDQPAVVAADVISDVLRAALGFDGVVVSDALDAPALDAIGSLGDRAVAAARAGVDLLIASTPDGCGEMQRAVSAAIAVGSIPLLDAQQAAARIERLRGRLGEAG
jgi:beta-N-acetylhexosaminidase